MFNQQNGFWADNSASGSGTLPQFAGPGSGLAWDPAYMGTGYTLSNSNETATFSAASGNGSVLGTRPLTGKVVFEVTLTSHVDITCSIGFSYHSAALLNNYTPGVVGNDSVGTWYLSGPAYYYNGNQGAAPAFDHGDCLAVLFDSGTGKIWFAKNGVLNGGDPAAGTGPAFTIFLNGDTYYPLFFSNSGSSANAARINHTLMVPLPAGFSQL